MVVQHVVVESCVAYSEASEFSGIPVLVLAAVYSSSNDSVSQEFLVEESSMSAEVSNQITNFGSYSSILMNYQSLKV